SSAASSTPPPRISKRRNFALDAIFGVSSPNGTSTSGLTFAAFSSPTSISMLIPRSSLRVNLFHLPDRSRVICARLVQSVQRSNLFVVRTRQRILRLNYLDVVRHACFEAISRLVHLFLRQLHSQIRHLYFIPRRFQIQERIWECNWRR